MAVFSSAAWVVTIPPEDGLANALILVTKFVADSANGMARRVRKLGDLHQLFAAGRPRAVDIKRSRASLGSRPNTLYNLGSAHIWSQLLPL